MKVVGRVADKCNGITSWNKGWIRLFIKQVPIITFAVSSASELKIKTVKFELCCTFSPAERTGSYSN